VLPNPRGPGLLAPGIDFIALRLSSNHASATLRSAGTKTD
jgi:hypothetical protein